MNTKLKNHNAYIWIAVIALIAANNAYAAKSCAVDNSASLTPLYQQTIINSASIPTGSVVVTMGESNWDHISNELRPRSDVTLINGAVGGCAIGGIARNNSKCWNTIPTNADVILLKPVNRSRGEDEGVYAANLEADTRRAIERIRDQRPNVSQVLLFSHHATPWSAPNGRGVPPKQGEPYSWWSGTVMQNIASNPPSGIEVVNAGYLWANGSQPRGDGLMWSCDLFDADGVHLDDPTGNRRAALEVDALLDNAIGGSPPPPPPPPSGDWCPADPTIHGCQWCKESSERALCGNTAYIGGPSLLECLADNSLCQTRNR